MNAPRRLAVVPPIVSAQEPPSAGSANAGFVVDPQSGYVDQVLRRRAFEDRFPDAEFTFHRPGVSVTFTLGARQVELHDRLDLGRLLDKCDAEVARETGP